jgi:hypothetical protein
MTIKWHCEPSDQGCMIVADLDGWRFGYALKARDPAMMFWLAIRALTRNAANFQASRDGR